MKSKFLYQITSQADCREKIGHDLSNSWLMSPQSNTLKKEDFYPNGNPFGSGNWRIELREQKLAETNNSGSPFQIYQFFDGAGSFAMPIQVFAVQDDG